MTNVSRRALIQAFPFIGAAVALPAVAASLPSPQDQMRAAMAQMREALSQTDYDDYMVVIMPNGERVFVADRKFLLPVIELGGTNV